MQGGVLGLRYGTGGRAGCLLRGEACAERGGKSKLWVWHGWKRQREDNLSCGVSSTTANPAINAARTAATACGAPPLKPLIPFPILQNQVHFRSNFQMTPRSPEDGFALNGKAGAEQRQAG